MSDIKQPQYKAFSVTKRKDKKDYWTAIGAGFTHGDNAGISIVLNAVPINGRVVLRPFDEVPGEK